MKLCYNVGMKLTEKEQEFLIEGICKAAMILLIAFVCSSWIFAG